MVEADPRTFDLFAPEESVIYPTEIVKGRSESFRAL